MTKAIPLTALLALTACNQLTIQPGPNTLAVGTWGADAAGVIVTDSQAHVHLGCTNGDFSTAGLVVDQQGRFEVAGSYLIKAFPVAQGPRHPATFTGQLRGDRLTLAVAVNDTIEKRVTRLGPVTVRLGQEPRMAPCPICKKPPFRP